MRPARRPATRAPRPSWQKISAAKIQAEIAKPRGAVFARGRSLKPDGGVDQRAERRGGDQEMQRQALLRHFGALAQARGHHPPADDRLERKQACRDGDLPAERAFELASPPEA